MGVGCLTKTSHSRIVLNKPKSASDVFFLFPRSFSVAFFYPPLHSDSGSDVTSPYNLVKYRRVKLFLILLQA